MTQRTNKPQAELHAHLGSSVDPAILWSIAHRQGIRLPSKDYWDFESMITMDEKKKNRNLDEMHNNFFHWTELIQSSPEAILESVKGVISGGYRKSNIVVNELRFNPMFRNRGGERDLDYIIMSAIWGMEQAILEHPQVKAGLILMSDRSLAHRLGEIIFQKAIRYAGRGVVGIDIAGPERKTFSMHSFRMNFKAAREAGLGITVHTGEAGSLKEMWYVVKEIRPQRIGHGVLAHKDKKLMRAIAEAGIVLEICPTSNLKNSVVKNVKEMKKIYRTLLRNGIKLTINTDGPEMYKTHILKEQEFLVKNGVLSQKEINQCVKWAFEASFIK